MKISKSLSIKRSKLFLHCIESQGGAGTKVSDYLRYRAPRDSCVIHYTVLFLFCYVVRFYKFLMVKVIFLMNELETSLFYFII